MAAAGGYDPDAWRGFFSLVGSGSATLTGLVFVALSLNLKDIVVNATHRYRAISALTGLASVFLRSSLVLIGGQGRVAVGLELAIVVALAGISFVVGFARTSIAGGDVSRIRVAATAVLYSVEVVAAVAFACGVVGALAVAAVALALNACYMITGAWLLVVGLFEDKMEGPAAGR